ncbi:type II secretion system protein J (GspJ) [Roseovarius marisflavi]|uniref:Type II secretion system protein J n=1 Tax=Roseovarius marisflavi TaxID=1054996 RepID=A0A1M6YQ94_9RHOB|nr:type II secretion system protein GspJ [Roseovarius marisflavi]SHL20199.1 type II secretion system protein J (GspJ) [Roseovarius marisflavi]
MSAPNPPRRAQDRGLTLLELVAVLSIFAMVAVMGLQALGGMMRARDRITDADEKAAALSRGLVLLRNDLKSVAALAFWPPESIEAEPAFLDQSADEGRLAFSTSGQPVLPDDQAAGQSRVIWRYDREDERLIRQVWPVLRPASEAALAPETVIFDNIASFRVSAYAGPEEGWVAGWGVPGPLPRPNLPDAVDIQFDSDVYGPLRVMVRF